MEGRAEHKDVGALVLEAMRESSFQRRSMMEELAERYPQEVFEALLARHVSLHAMKECRDNHHALRRVWLALRKVEACKLTRLHLLWETLLQTEMCRMDSVVFSNTLAALLGQHFPVPGEVARRVTERRDDLGIALRLLSAEPDVPELVVEILSGTSSSHSHNLVACLQVAVARHGVDVMPHLRRSIASNRGNVCKILKLLSASGVQFEDECVFSEEEWAVLPSDWATMQEVAQLFRRDRRPDRLVSAYVANIRRELQGVLTVFSFGHWFTREEADELVVLYDIGSFEDGAKQARWLGAVVSQPWASPDVRFAVMRKRLGASALFHNELQHKGADWTAFGDDELLELIKCCDALLGHDAVAKELCRRGLEPRQLRGFVGPAMEDPDVLESRALALCRYAVHNVSLFKSVQLDSAEEGFPTDRAVVYAIVGRWTRQMHPFLPRDVQAVAMVTLWALTRRMGTRHLVYKVLEYALRPTTVDPFRAMGLPRVRSIVALLRRAS